MKFIEENPCAIMLLLKGFPSQLKFKLHCTQELGRGTGGYNFYFSII